MKYFTINSEKCSSTFREFSRKITPSIYVGCGRKIASVRHTCPSRQKTACSKQWFLFVLDGKYHWSFLPTFGSGNHELLRELLTELSMESKHFVLMGDFNYRYRQWPPADASEVGPNASHFYDCLEENFFTQHVDMPTRDANILDLVITDEPDLVKWRFGLVVTRWLRST